MKYLLRECQRQKYLKKLRGKNTYTKSKYFNVNQQRNKKVLINNILLFLL